MECALARIKDKYPDKVIVTREMCIRDRFLFVYYEKGDKSDTFQYGRIMSPSFTSLLFTFRYKWGGGRQ